MIKLKSIVLVSLLLVGFTQMSFGQSCMGKGEKTKACCTKDGDKDGAMCSPEKMVEMMGEVLTLKEDQKAKISEIVASHNTKLEEIKGKFKDEKELESVRMEVKKSQEISIQNVLTEDQRKAWDNHQATKKEACKDKAENTKEGAKPGACCAAKKK